MVRLVRVEGEEVVLRATLRWPMLWRLVVEVAVAVAVRVLRRVRSVGLHMACCEESADRLTPDDAVPIRCSNGIDVERRCTAPCGA